MLKLYRFSDAKKEYWETWKEGKGERLVHWGELGTRGACVHYFRGREGPCRRANLGA